MGLDSLAYARKGLLTVCLLVAVGQNVLALELGQRCTNPKGESGQCIFFRDCPPLVKMFMEPFSTLEDKQFLEGSRCGTIERKALVCCPGVGPGVAPVPPPNRNTVLPKFPQCGIQLTGRIIDGQPTEIDEFPWAVLIKYEKPYNDHGFHCGGSLINERYVLTAAHCIKPIPRSWKVHQVRLGEWDLSTDPDCNEYGVCNNATIDMDIEKIIVHSGYDTQDKNHLNDIALIRMARNVEYSASIRAICLPLSNAVINTNHDGTSSLAAGWGKTESGSASLVKLKVELAVKSLQECSPVYRRNGIFLQSTQMCVGGMKRKDTCTGDSGGPLMRQFAGAWYLIGVVSFGPSKCGTADVPGVYTDVSKFADWIRENVY